MKIVSQNGKTVMETPVLYIDTTVSPYGAAICAPYSGPILYGCDENTAFMANIDDALPMANVVVLAVYARERIARRELEAAISSNAGTWCMPGDYDD